jgi:hypothetical protein
MPAQQPDGDLLVGYDTVHAFLVRLGMPEHVDLYYLRRTRRWPIGNTGGRCTGGGKLIASKRQLTEYVNEITSGSPLGRNLLASKLRIGRHAKKTAIAQSKRRAAHVNQLPAE